MPGISASAASRGCSLHRLSALTRSGSSGPSASIITGVGEIMVAARFPVLAIVLVQILSLEVVKDEHVEVVYSLARIGLACGVGCSGPPEPVPALVFAARVAQGVRVGVEQPGRACPAMPVGQFGYLQRDNGSLGEALVPADARLDDAQLDLNVAVKAVRLG